MQIKSVLSLFLLTNCLSAAPVFSFQLFSAPDAFITAATGLNDHGEVVGSFVPSGTSDQRGFIRHPDGSFEIVDFPGSTQVTLFGINNAGVIVGDITNNGESRAFIRNPDGSFFFFDIPTSSDTAAVGINDAGIVVGQAAFPVDGGGSESVTLTRKTDGSFFLNNVLPEAEDQLMADINSAGRAVGTGLVNGRQVGFIANGDGSDVTRFTVPGALDTSASGINDAGQIAGGATFEDVTRPYILQPDGRFTFLEIPGTFGAVAFGINNRGDIAGFAGDLNGSQVAFIGTFLGDGQPGGGAQTPEPVSLALAASGLALILLGRKLR